SKIPFPKSSVPDKVINSGKYKGNFYNASYSRKSSSTFASILKGDAQKHSPPEQTKPDLVLDDLCIKERDFSKSLMGQVKEVSAIPNLYIVLLKEDSYNSDDEPDAPDAPDEGIRKIHSKKKHYPSHNMEASSQRTTSMPITGGSILEVMDDLVKVGHAMGNHKIYFVALQETKMESIDSFSIKALGENLAFDHAMCPSVGVNREKGIMGLLTFIDQ
ncbi:hypothetical protein Tco_1423132, partial [Tanacetum coccineum]